MVDEENSISIHKLSVYRVYIYLDLLVMSVVSEIDSAYMICRFITIHNNEVFLNCITMLKIEIQVMNRNISRPVIIIKIASIVFLLIHGSLEAIPHIVRLIHHSTDVIRRHHVT